MINLQKELKNQDDNSESLQYKNALSVCKLIK